MGILKSEFKSYFLLLLIAPLVITLLVINLKENDIGFFFFGGISVEFLHISFYLWQDIQFNWGNLLFFILAVICLIASVVFLLSINDKMELSRKEGSNDRLYNTLQIFLVILSVSNIGVQLGLNLSKYSDLLMNF